jgi:hypothetical protein
MKPTQPSVTVVMDWKPVKMKEAAGDLQVGGAFLEASAEQQNTGKYEIVIIH